MNGEWIRICDVVAKFKAISWHSLGETEKIRPRFEYESEEES
jgi:hypothetical protein